MIKIVLTLAFVMQNVANLKPCFSDGRRCHQGRGCLTAMHLVCCRCMGTFHSSCRCRCLTEQSCWQKTTYACTGPQGLQLSKRVWPWSSSPLTNGGGCLLLSFRKAAYSNNRKARFCWFASTVYVGILIFGGKNNCCWQIFEMCLGVTTFGVWVVLACLY